MLPYLLMRITTWMMKLPGHSTRQQFKGAQIDFSLFFILFLALFIFLALFRAKLHVDNTHSPGYLFA